MNVDTGEFRALQAHVAGLAETVAELTAWRDGEHAEVLGTLHRVEDLLAERDRQATRARDIIRGTPPRPRLRLVAGDGS